MLLLSVVAGSLKVAYALNHCFACTQNHLDLVKIQSVFQPNGYSHNAHASKLSNGPDPEGLANWPFFALALFVSAV